MNLKVPSVSVPSVVVPSIVVRSIVVAVALAATALCGAARAETPGYTIEDVTACSADAMRLCRSRMPDIDAIEDCMKEHYAELRPKCKARFDRDH